MKQALKFVAFALATLAVLPAAGLYLVSSWLMGAERAFPGWSQAFSLLPGFVGAYGRRAFYRLVLDRCGTDAWLGFGTIISHPTARIGDRAYVGAFCCLGDVTVGDDVLLGSHVSVANGGAQHGIERLDIPIREQPGQWPRVTIGQDSWIGDRAVILADVGRHCVIGAGAVVTRPIPDYGIAHGVPAKVASWRKEPADQPAPPCPVGG
ncbi:MAG TPA: acyltransferase [Gemmataceae bacterium]|nr:acyltransferase [Gemmataceae bacterium]